MDFSKRLCLVLFYTGQFGQVLATNCAGDHANGQTVTCKEKKGETVKLTITGTSAVTWKKGDVPITPSDTVKYQVVQGPAQSLAINNLAEGDEGIYKADGTSPEEKFNVKVVDCFGDASTHLVCQGKLGVNLKLAAKETVSSIVWKKVNTPIANLPDAKYGPIAEDILMIKNLDDTDEGFYTVETPESKFAVQVADCFGDTSSVTCKGDRSGNLKLRVSGTATGPVVWMKGSTSLTGEDPKYAKSRPHGEGLTIKSLDVSDEESYTAKYNSPAVTQVFNVKVFGVCKTNGDCLVKKNGKVRLESGDPKATWKHNDDLVTGSRFTPSAGNLEIQDLQDSDLGTYKAMNGVSVKKTIQLKFPAVPGSNPQDDNGKPRDGNGKLRDGGAGGLSYSPALLVTVTLLHLLLQLAA